jgi:hypothetical protein
MGNCLAWHAARRNRRHPPQVRSAAAAKAQSAETELVFEGPSGPTHVIGSSGQSDDDDDDDDDDAEADRDADARHGEDSLALARQLAEGAAEVVEAHFAARGAAQGEDA